ncbi:hypothetical protein RhiirA1_187296 [Rhizophagus irregularis]|uniref:Uncharacterized protein n=1 Tax=Rhizophagus irregularis TaxID=588596 RepID=A0A2N0RSE4_9GLOM|nr:hypothetical protein RhiirA1_187296 [Rhizophagus irregularis]
MYILTGSVNPQSGPQEPPQPQQPQQPPQPEEHKPPEPQEYDIPEPTEKTEEELNKEKSVKEKELGNTAYKKREFEEALKHYDKAWELDPTNASILTNKAGEYSNR